MKAIIVFALLLSGQLFAQLPSDLQKLQDRYNTLVSSNQDDFFLTIETLRISEDQSLLTLAVSSYLDKYSSLYQFNFRRGIGIDEIISNLTIENDDGYFCSAFSIIQEKNNYGGMIDSDCRVLSELLLEDAKGLELSIAHFEGEDWGDWATIDVFIISAQDPSYALRYSFDLYHEI